MRRSTLPACGLLLSMACSAQAQDGARFYTGIGGGASPLDTGLSALRLLGGVELNDYVSVEASAARLRGGTGRYLDDSRFYSVNARLQVPQFHQVSPFLTLGVDQARTHNVLDQPVRTFGLDYGVGVETMILKRLQLRVEWQNLNTTCPGAQHPNLLTFTVGTRF